MPARTEFESAMPRPRGNPVTVRLALAGDAEAVSSLCGEHAAFERIPFSPAGHALRLRHLLEASCSLSPDHDALATRMPLYVWIAEMDGEIIGYVAASPAISTLDAAVYIHMDCLHVRPGDRGRGIGWLLMQEAMSCGLAMGCGRMEWQTPRWNEPAARFYLKHGARERIKRRFALELTRSS
jgi:ribosomal protein S18 acetylase RimI-like enzyme